ncbi:hypothetical protein [Parapedobacter sp. 10938]|uniref:hypothetical protein n=1 Tax=Parapedobacter flavus TaxID=3110225 RepID=UPI002DB5703C|nr:hypothetical protein [Parapedobacter sp. 10938]MEC3880601.1 hypothetical protein [Parapedobacter sp. 10938]
MEIKQHPIRAGPGNKNNGYGRSAPTDLSQHETGECKRWEGTINVKSRKYNNIKKNETEM